jgi:hypothetical protein
MPAPLDDPAWHFDEAIVPLLSLVSDHRAILARVEHGFRLSGGFVIQDEYGVFHKS